MKTKFPLGLATLGVTLTLMSAPTFAQTVNDDLTTVDIELSQETQDEIRRGLQGLSDMNRGTSTDVPDTISVPDYKPVYYAMRSRIVTSLTQFTIDVQNLHDKVRRDLSKVAALENMKESSPQYKQIYNEEAKRAFVKIGSYLNKDYQGAIKRLYTLDGMLDLAVTQNKSKFKNLFKESLDGRTKLESMCSTALCLGKVTKDITEWVKLVDSMNINVDVIQPSEKLTFSDKTSSVSSINHFSSAINDFTKSLIKVGLKPNTVYSTGEAAATYLGQIGRSTFGVAFALVTFPAKVINGAFRGVAKLDLSKDILIKDLSLKKVETYDIKKAVEDMVAVSMKLETETSVAAGDQEIARFLKRALDKYSSEKDYIIKYVVPADQNFKSMIEKFYPEYLSSKPESKPEAPSVSRDSSEERGFGYLTSCVNYSKHEICGVSYGEKVRNIRIDGYQVAPNKFTRDLVCRAFGFSNVIDYETHRTSQLRYNPQDETVEQADWKTKKLIRVVCE